MIVRLAIEDDSQYYSGIYQEAKIPFAPKVGDVLAGDFHEIRDYIIEKGQVERFKSYLAGRSARWFSDEKLQKTTPKPTDEELREDLDFEFFDFEVERVVWEVKKEKVIAVVFLNSVV